MGKGDLAVYAQPAPGPWPLSLAYSRYKLASSTSVIVGAPGFEAYPREIRIAI